MALFEKFLYLKKSLLPGAGKGLFTKVDIPKGKRIIEYKGKIEKWKDVKDDDGRNAYLFRLNRSEVINAEHRMKALARYINDARGFSKIKGMKNNCEYDVEDNHCYVTSIRKIHKGEELLVPYGKDYWDLMKSMRLGSETKARGSGKTKRGN